MRTIRRFEASDIKPENKVHTAMMAGITLALIEMRGATKETIMDDMKSTIANFLNLLADMEIDVVDREEIPAVFRAGFASDNTDS
jgi:hypothetical protein